MRGPENQQFTFDLKKMCCSCMLRSLTGIPCVHSIAAIHTKGLNPHDFVDKYYVPTTFCKLYKNVLQPINGQSMWPGEEELLLDPPDATSNQEGLK